MKTAVETIFVGKRVSTIADSQAAYEGRFPSARSISSVARYQPVVAWMLLFWRLSLSIFYNTSTTSALHFGSFGMTWFNTGPITRCPRT
ncbi:hypothetical protein XH86_03685 [Bradyrhizobium guangdongense]|uniref:Uncharacterized protein n=1 Tax=Bradyrhizobium guangdongense TaxID=1325090 RepID=A0ABX6U9E5_9BRAD|nr:hypothetical protein X265_03690 [Bradyrhizobium guangdongense]QOZ57950.1 hypothetical protein XH86_03685 [Bradyrhizobium guangdongense]